MRDFIGLFCVMSLNIRDATLLRYDCNKKHFNGRGVAILCDPVMLPFGSSAGARRGVRISVEVLSNIRYINGSQASI